MPNFDICFGEFWTQLKVLCWKNWTLKLRNWSTLLLELFLPTVIILALWGIMNVTKPSVTKESIPSTSYGTGALRDFGRSPPCQGEPRMNLLWSCDQPSNCPGVGPYIYDTDSIFDLGCLRMFIAVAPHSASDPDATRAAREFIAWAESNPECNGNLTDATYMFFSSEAAIKSHVTSRTYSIDGDVPLISSAVVFVSGAPTWQYTLRFNSSMELPDTASSDVDSSVKYRLFFHRKFPRFLMLISLTI